MNTNNAAEVDVDCRHELVFDTKNIDNTVVSMAASGQSSDQDRD